MIKVCAIDPEVMGEWRWFNFLEPHFGVSEGRLIAEFPNDWRREVLQRADRLVESGINKELQRAKLVERMTAGAFRRKLIAAGFEYDRNLPWPRNAARHDFGLVIVPGENAGGKFLGIEALEFCKGCVETERNRDVVKTLEATFGCARLLIAKARRIALVDPNFHIVADRWWNAVAALLSHLSRDSMPNCLVEIHTERKAEYDRAKHKLMWDQKMRGKVPPGVRLRCVYWEKLPVDKALHPRYLLTDRGGMHYDNGFDSQPGISQQVTLLDDAYWESLFAVFDSDNLPPGFDRDRFVVE